MCAVTTTSSEIPTSSSNSTPIHPHPPLIILNYPQPRPFTTSNVNNSPPFSHPPQNQLPLYKSPSPWTIPRTILFVPIVGPRHTEHIYIYPLNTPPSSLPHPFAPFTHHLLMDDDVYKPLISLLFLPPQSPCVYHIRCRWMDVQNPPIKPCKEHETPITAQSLLIVRSRLLT